MKKETILNLIYMLIAVLFLYTGISKFWMFESSRVSLKQALIVGPIGNELAILLPATEIVIALALFSSKFESLALRSAFVLMILFTLYSAYVVFLAVKIPCSCGGIMKEMTWRQHLIFNSCFTALAYIALLIKKRINKPITVAISQVDINRLNY